MCGHLGCNQRPNGTHLLDLFRKSSQFVFTHGIYQTDVIAEHLRTVCSLVRNVRVESVSHESGAGTRER
jgi:hypothetical protein